MEETALGVGRRGRAGGLVVGDRGVLLGRGEPQEGPVLLRYHRDQLSLSRLLRPGTPRRPVLALVPGTPLRAAALQREPGGILPPAQVPALSLARDMAGAEPRHGAVHLADRCRRLRLASPARRAGGGPAAGGGALGVRGFARGPAA